MSTQEEREQLVKDTFMKAIEVIPEPWRSKCQEHGQPECDWGDPFTDEHTVRCRTHDVVILPAPEEIVAQVEVEDLDRTINMMEMVLLKVVNEGSEYDQSS